MMNSMGTNFYVPTKIIFLQELSKDLSSNLHQLPAKFILIQMIGFSKKNLHEKIFITFTPSSSSSSSLFYNEQIFIFQKKIKAIFKTKKLKNK